MTPTYLVTEIENRFQKQKLSNDLSHVRNFYNLYKSLMFNCSDWPFNNGECQPTGPGNSRCASCCDNTKQAKTRACNLDTYLDKQQGNSNF